MPSSSAAKDFEFVNPDDFKSIQIRISIMNTTTRTEIRGPADSEGGEGIRLVELRDREFVFDVAKKSCAEGHHLLMRVEAALPNSKGALFSLNLTGKVLTAKSPRGAESQIIEVSMVQYDETSWTKFCDIFNKRQKEIEDFFNAVKGV